MLIRCHHSRTNTVLLWVLPKVQNRYRCDAEYICVVGDIHPTDSVICQAPTIYTVCIKRLSKFLGRLLDPSLSRFFRLPTLKTMPIAFVPHYRTKFPTSRGLIPLFRFECPCLNVLTHTYVIGDNLDNQSKLFPIPPRTRASRHSCAIRQTIRPVLSIRTAARTTGSPKVSAFLYFLAHFAMGVCLNVQIGVRHRLHCETLFLATGVYTHSNLLSISLRRLFIETGTIDTIVPIRRCLTTLDELARTRIVW